MDHFEIEVKFFLADPAPIRKKILGLGAETIGSSFEKNICYDDSDGSLFAKKSLLRLREDSGVSLTFKHKPSDNDREFKIQHELEVLVDDSKTMDLILQRIGFHRQIIYEKERETIVLGGTVFCMDALPYGHFLEIEGRKEEIKTYADKIGLLWEKRITLTYLGIFSMLKVHFNLGFNDPSFENFEKADLSLSEINSLLYDLK